MPSPGLKACPCPRYPQVGVAVGREILMRTTASGRLAMCWLAVKPIVPVSPCNDGSLADTLAK